MVLQAVIIWTQKAAQLGDQVRRSKLTSGLKQRLIRKMFPLLFKRLNSIIDVAGEENPERMSITAHHEETIKDE